MKGNMKNFFGMNFEWGLSKDRNIASTLMGVAVKNTYDDCWYAFDSSRNARTNLTSMKMGNFPVFLLPTKVLEVGDLTKMDGKYYYVQKIENGILTLLGAADGIIRQILPSESIILGMNIYTKVVAFDTKTLIDPASEENMSGNILAAMCMMQWSKGESEFSLDSINDDSFNGLGSCLPVLLALNGGSSNFSSMLRTSDGNEINLPLLMMMGSGNDSNEANEMVQIMLLSQMLGDSNGKAKCGTATVKINTGKNCINCGATLKEGAKFCHVCGKKVEVLRFCSACGEKNDPDDNFCVHCGNSLKEVVNPTSTEEKETAEVDVAPAEIKK